MHEPAEKRLEGNYNPLENTFFGDMLVEAGYLPQMLRAYEVRRPDNNLETGILFTQVPGNREGSASILVLYPSVGTGVVPHPGLHHVDVRHLGAILRDVSPGQVACKLQTNWSDTREPSLDRTDKYDVGASFTPLRKGQFGYFHGFHNLGGQPIALEIDSTFSELRA